MKPYLIDGETVDLDTEVIIICNRITESCNVSDYTSDSSVSLCKALDADPIVDTANANWIYYVRSVDDEISIIKGDNTTGIEILGLPIADVRAAIISKLTDSETGEYPLEYIRGV